MKLVITVGEWHAVRRIMRGWGYNPYDTALIWDAPLRTWLGERR